MLRLFTERLATFRVLVLSGKVLKMMLGSLLMTQLYTWKRGC